MTGDRPLNVLLVEDEASLRIPLKRHLENKFHFRVDDAACPAETLKLISIAEVPYDVALIDDVLAPGAEQAPESAGIDLMMQIKAHHPETECILFTGWGMERALEALRAGAYRYLPKPLHMEELGVTIQMAAEQSRLRQERDELHQALRDQYEELKKAKGLIGARTALAWMGMTSSAWRHAVDKFAQTIREQVQLLRRDLEGHVVEQDAQVSMRLSRIEKLANQILEKPIIPPLSSDEGEETIIVNELVGERVRQLWRNDPYKTVKLGLELWLSDTATVRGSREWLRRALDILIDNAVEAVLDSETQVITVGTRSAGGKARILVSDTGTGISEEIEAKIGLEFIEKPGDAMKLGRGLLMAQTIVQTYGGEIRVDSTGPTGTTMVISLPLEPQTLE